MYLLPTTWREKRKEGGGGIACGKQTGYFETTCIREVVVKSSPEPGSSAEGLGGEETPSLGAQTRR